jgi:hypothetical protein
MARMTTHVLAALTQVVTDTSLCPKKNSNYVLSNSGDLADYSLVFSFVCFACKSNESKSLQNFMKKKTHFVGGGKYKYNGFLLYFDYILEPII